MFSTNTREVCNLCQCLLKKRQKGIKIKFGKPGKIIRKNDRDSCGK